MLRITYLRQEGANQLSAEIPRTRFRSFNAHLNPSRADDAMMSSLRWEVCKRVRAAIQTQLVGVASSFFQSVECYNCHDDGALQLLLTQELTP